MRHSRHIRYLTYPSTRGERVYSIFIWPLIIIVGLVVFITYVPPSAPSSLVFSVGDLFAATIYTMLRLIVAYILALAVAVPLAIVATEHPVAEKVLLPAFDILESVPVLAFFPILIIFFVNIHFLNGAAIFILFLSMLWNIVFTVVGGLKIIPKDIKYVGEVFNIRGFNYFRRVLLPSIFPEIVTGSILAVAQGWNIIIVAEVIHAYVPGVTEASDLYGIGSIIVNASAAGDTHLFVLCIAIMICVIALFNYFVWQKLIRYAEKFKFE